jgi:peptidoglycan/xylan/chitin deacetylase (PgdA/CDA1 family)
MNRPVYSVLLSTLFSVVVLFGNTGETAHAATNLIQNPSLETATGAVPTSWKKGQWGSLTATFTYPDAGYQGGKAATLSVSNYVNGDAKWFFNDVTVTPGTTYTFTNVSLSNSNSGVTARFRKQNGTYTYLYLGTVTGTGTWKEFQKTFTVPAGITAVTVFHTLATNGTLAVDNYSLVSASGGNQNEFSEGMVTFSFDDGFRNTYEVGLPILEAHGIRSTQAIITKSFTDPTYVTAAETIDIQRRGHEIASHTRTHAHLTTLTKSKLNAEVRGSRNDLTSIGITPVTTIVYPYGEYNETVIAAAKTAGYTGGRGVVSGYNTPTTNEWELHDQHVTSGVSFATVRGWIDYAVANKLWLILELHQQNVNGGEYSNNPALLEQIASYVDNQNIKTITLGEGLGLLAQ